VYADKVCAEVTAGTYAADETFAATCNQLTPIVSTQLLHSILNIASCSASCILVPLRTASSSKPESEHAYSGR